MCVCVWIYIMCCVYFVTTIKKSCSLSNIEGIKLVMHGCYLFLGELIMPRGLHHMFLYAHASFLCCRFSILTVSNRGVTLSFLQQMRLLHNKLHLLAMLSTEQDKK